MGVQVRSGQGRVGAGAEGEVTGRRVGGGGGGKQEQEAAVAAGVSAEWKPNLAGRCPFVPSIYGGASGGPTAASSG